MKIYLAGPDVFRGNAIEHGKMLKNLCKERDHEGLFPLDNEIVPLDSKKIFESNFEMIKQCDVVLANITPFRGPSADAGTAWEMGAAKALGKKVVLYDRNVILNYKDKAKGNSEFPIVEDFNLSDNLMLIHGADGIYNSFEKALDSLEKI